MTDTMRERIARAFWRVNCDDISYDEARLGAERGNWRDASAVQFAQEVADAIIAEMRVCRPLVWRAYREVGHGKCNYGFGAFGHWYAASKSSPKSWHCMTHIGGNSHTVGYFPTLEAAKAAANAHYRQQIARALGIAPEGEA